MYNIYKLHIFEYAFETIIEIKIFLIIHVMKLDLTYQVTPEYFIWKRKLLLEKKGQLMRL